MNQDPAKDQGERKEIIGQDEKKRLFELASAALMSERAVIEASHDETLTDADGKTVNVRRRLIDAADFKEPTTLVALHISQVHMGYIPEYYDDGRKYPETVTLVIREQGLPEDDDGKFYALSRLETLDVEIATWGDTVEYIAYDKTTDKPAIDPSEDDENVASALLPVDRPITANEALELRSVLMALQEVDT